MPGATHQPKTPILKIDLSHHADKFNAGSQVLSIDKKVSFIFGKNGTGKTTITDEILKQLSTNYDVCVFKDFDGVVENDRLNAVALGTGNAKIQKKIELVDNEITVIKSQVEEQKETNTDNLFTKATKSNIALVEHEEKLNKFYISSAQKIKNLSHPQVAKTTYNKASFQADISKANLLAEENIETYRNTINADQKSDAPDIHFPDIDLLSYLKSTNEILQSNVPQTQDIPELTDNKDKQAFAREGMKIHDHKAGVICAFCGSEISEERWQILGSYFNDEVKKLETRIVNGIAKINAELDNIKEIKEVSENITYDVLTQDLKTLNLQIIAKRGEYKEFLDNLRTALEEKKSSLFVKSALLKTNVPEGFDNIEKEYEGFVKKHNTLSRNLKTEQDRARDALRYHEVKIILDEYNYNDVNIQLAVLKATNNEALDALNDKKIELQKKQEERKALILQTKSEEIIAKKINKLLSNMGVKSFSLKLVDDAEGQKGQYQIKGHDESIRPVMQLSRGEKNIIAFLYFIFSLDNIDSENKPKIIVLDDPMTSNDDTMQYLMIGEIQKLYQNLKDGNYILVLTHNCHFYLNVRPHVGNDFYDKYGVHHLLSDGKHTTIKACVKGKHDFRTSYETLWKELVFLYNAKDATADLMLGPCRKICETYMKFSRKGIEAFYKQNTNAKKLFDVNQHSIDDFEAEANGKSKDEIKVILEKLFEDNGAEDHIKSHWKGGEL